MPLRVFSFATAIIVFAVEACCANAGGIPAFSHFVRGSIGVARLQRDAEVPEIHATTSATFGRIPSTVTYGRGAVYDASSLCGCTSTFIIHSPDGNEVVGTFVDFGDLYDFNVYFDEVRVDSVFRPNSYELMKQHVLGASPGVNTRATGWRFDSFLEDWQIGFGEEVRATNPVDRDFWRSINNGRLRAFARDMRTSTYATAGLRINDYRSWFDVDMVGSILGRSQARVMNDHVGIGPQGGLGAVAESSIWRFEAVMLAFIGYRHTEYELNGLFGEQLIPGAVNRPIPGRATTTSIDKSEDDFAWGLETRLTAGAQLTQRLRFDAIWRWAVVGPIYDASRSLSYTAPNFSFTESGDRGDEYVSDLFLGLTYVR